MMDVSGSMGDEQKELVRLEAFWIDAWLRRNYHGIESRYIVHDVRAAEVDRDAVGDLVIQCFPDALPGSHHIPAAAWAARKLP